METILEVAVLTGIRKGSYFEANKVSVERIKLVASVLEIKICYSMFSSFSFYCELSLFEALYDL